MSPKLLIKQVFILFCLLILTACQSDTETTFPGQNLDINNTTTNNNVSGGNDQGTGSSDPVPADPVDPVPADPVDPVPTDPVDPVPADPVPVDPVAIPGNPPRNITASVDTFTGNVAVSWEIVTGASYYELWRSTVADIKGTQIGSPTVISFNDSNTIPGTGYWYGLKACNDAGCSGFSGQANVTSPANVIPAAADDSVTTEMDVSVNINVLSNDTGLNDGSIQTSVLTASAKGTAIVEADNSITYTPDLGVKGSDSFTYQVKDKDNDMATATVLINIVCSSCPAPTTFSLSWNPNTDTIDGYYVYFGATASTTSTIILATTNTTAIFDPMIDLSLQTGDTACFRLKAYTSVGESGFSDAICTTI